MEIIRGLCKIRKRHRNGILTIGIFDGVHIGHQAIIRNVIERSRSRNRKSVVLTFYPHPLEILGEEIKSITTLDEKIKLIKDLGVDIIVVLRFTKKFALLSPKQFIRKVFLRLCPFEIVVGPNHTFGEKGKGNVFFLKKAGEVYNFKTNIVKLEKHDGKYVNSTEIRSLLCHGNVEKAKVLMGRYFSLAGEVIKGRGRGKVMSFPTANLKVPRSKLLPGNGVYTSFVWRDKKRYKGIVNVGYRPTFTKRLCRPSIEVFLLNFKGNLYGKSLKVEFVKKIREEKKFLNIEDLKRQIKKDVKIANKIWR